MTDDDILTDLEAFNDAMVHFKEAVDGRDLERMPIIFNQLLTILKHIIETYRLIDSIDVLEYATKLIYLLQDVHSSDNTNYNPEPFSNAIDQLALCLTARITNRFIRPSSSSNSDAVDSNDKNNLNTSSREADTLLDILVKRTDGVDIAHEHAKYLSKYMFSLTQYIQERSVEELGHAERTSKLINNCSLSTFLTTYRYLPGIDLMMKQIKKDTEYYSKIQSTWMLLQTHEFVGKIESWRTYHDSVRKTVKTQWDKSFKKCQQALQIVEDARTNSKSVINLPTSSSSSSTSSDPLTHSVNLSITLPHHHSLQRTASSPPNIIHTATAPAPLPLPPTNETNLQSALNDLDIKQKELQLTKHETLTILNKLINNTENLIIDSLNTYFRSTDFLTNSSSAFIPRSKNDLASSYTTYIHSLPPSTIQDDNSSSSSIKDSSVRRIPFVIQLCCHCIEQLEGHKIKGIYRLSGVKSKVDHLCRQFVQGIELNETDLINNFSAIVLANAVKKYLRELPIPLLLIAESTDSSLIVQNELMNIGKEICQSSNQISPRINERLRQIIDQRISDYAKQALIHLLKHLYLISLSEQENQMSAANLGIVFGPTLFKSQQRMEDDTTLSTLLEAPYQAKLVEYLIANDLFSSDI
ncbi:unnamed protein product [Adineta steineri]|uniref:Rho-GAP domain-containing protein n=2 Tax=Adineta steineri TaxID=433720 RepID=A0A814TJH9_9BILA|nr:unnamed protein product [Adineta steineri]